MMNDFTYKDRRLSHTEEMFHVVFSSKVVFAMVVLSCIVCLADIVLAICCAFMTKEFTPENLDKYIMLIPDGFIDTYDGLKGMGAAIAGMMYFFGALAGAYFWIAVGMILIYVRTKNLDPQKSVRTGFTLIQAFGIFKLVVGGMWMLVCIFVGFVMLQDMQTSIAGMMLLVIIAVNLMYTISIIVFCSSVKRTADGIIPSAAGAGALQFSSFITGLIQGIIAVLLLMSVFSPMEAEYMPAENMALIEKVKFDFVVLTAVWIVAAVIHFLVFTVVRLYAKKLPLASNADMVYKNNMANLYPDMYSPNQNYQSPQQNYQPYNPNQNYSAFQPPENNNTYVPYDSKNDVDDHSLMDNTSYPPYENGNH